MKKINISSCCLCIRSNKFFLFFSFVAVTFLVYGFLFGKIFVHASTEGESSLPPTEISGVISEDTTWIKAKSPYIVTSSLLVDEGVTLTIEPGVVVKFDPNNNISMHVFGKIIANGEPGNEIYFTSNYDDQVGGSTDEDYEDCFYNDYDEEGNGIGEETCIMMDWYEPWVADWTGFYFLSSEDSILKNVFIKYSDNAVTSKLSNIKFENLNIENSFSGITGYDHSEVEILGGNINNLSNDAFTFFTSSNLAAENVKVSGVHDGFVFFGTSNLNIKNSSLYCFHDGLTFYNNSNLLISKMDITCDNDGIVLFNNASADISGAKISGSLDSGVIAFNNTNPDTIKINKSEITGNNYGLIVWDSIFSAHQNSIHNNITKGVDTYSDLDLDFTSNYWGDKTGPLNGKTNPTGLGNEVSDHVLYSPFLKYDPLINVRNPVILIPGITGSYLYKNYGDKEEIWPNILKLMSPTSMSDSHLDDLVLNEDGTEKSEFPIITGDIIRGVANVHVFDNLIKELNKDGYIEGTDLFVFPYDWRMSTKNSAILLKNKIEEVLLNSGQEKVDIVAHSMGGLVAKKYIADNGKNNIDQLVFLGTPQLGAPKALKTLMFGDNMGYEKIFLGLNKLRAKFISQNMPSVYELLPSKKYIEENGGYALNSMYEILGLKSVVLDYPKTKEFMINKGRNPLMFPFAEDLHNSVDDLDLSEIGTYNIVGCGSPTIGEITMTQKRSWKKLFLGLADDYRLKYIDGDETVPLNSSIRTIGSDIYYAVGVSHGSLPASESVIQGILAILKDEGLTFGDILKDNSSRCGIKGKIVSTHSPVNLHIYDEQGNHTGLNEDGDIEYGIEGVSFDILEGENYVFLPNDRNFKIITKATDTGGYNFMIEDQDENENITSVNKWTLIPLSTLNTTGEIWLGPSYSADKYEVKIDKDGDGGIDNIYTEGFDGTELAESLTKKDKENRSSYLSGSISYKNEILNIKDNFIFAENKLEDNKDKDNENKKVIFGNKDKIIESTQEDVARKEIMDNNLSASVISLYSENSGRIILQMLIVGGFVLLLLSLRFIFKII